MANTNELNAQMIQNATVTLLDELVHGEMTKSDVERKCGVYAASAAESLFKNGFAVWSGDSLKITNKGQDEWEAGSPEMMLD